MPTSLLEFRDRVKQEEDWLIPGLLTRGNTAFMIGPPKKASKSWLILDMCWSLSEGSPLWGIMDGQGQPLFSVPTPLKCVYFTQEDTMNNIHDRTMNHFARGREANDKFWIVSKNLNMKFDMPEGRAIIERELDEVAQRAGGIDLVCFDPMRRMHSGDENDSAGIAKMWDVLDKMHGRYRCGTLIAHHTTKPPSDRANYDPTDPFIARGSGDIYGGGDAFLVVVPGPGTTEFRKVSMHFESKRGKPIAPAMLKVTYKTGLVEWLGQGWDYKRKTEEEL